jgi:hypothetical protein
MLLLSVVIAGPAVWLPVEAGRTRSWIENPADLQTGEADGVAITRNGKLFLAPRLSRLNEEFDGGLTDHVWSIASDSRDNIYLGTGPEGRILRVDPSGRQRTHFTAPEPMVTALAFNENGELLAATAPGGKIYRISEAGDGELWAETEQRYVWAIAVAGDGTIYAATGESGTIRKIGNDGRSSVFFESDELHIRTLLPLADGSVLAGGASRGLIYRVDADGNALVLYDDDLPEVVSLAVETDGSVVAALIAAPDVASKVPAVRIRLPDGQQVGLPGSGVSTTNDEQTQATIHGVIEGLPDSEDSTRSSIRGRVVRIAPDGEKTTLWRSVEASPYAMTRDGRGNLLFGAGEPGRLYRIEPEDDVALLATLPEAQVTGLLATGRTVLVATSNPATAYRLEEQGPESGVFLSRVFDAGGPARWGSIRWRVEPVAGRAELYTRTGNSETPGPSWSAWSPALTDARGSAIVNPDGRFLQWRVRLAGSESASSRLSAVTVLYEPHNRAPSIHNLRLDGESRAVSDEATLRWNSSDPDRDRVDVEFEYRALDTGDWVAMVQDTDGAEGDSSDNRRVWKTGDLAEGRYEIRAIASDHAANHPGEGRRVTHRKALSIVVDRSPPELTVRRLGGGQYEVAVVDGHSDVGRLELMNAERLQFSARPVDGLCDSPRETFRFELPGDAGGDWSVRVLDAAGNAVEAPISSEEDPS